VKRKNATQRRRKTAAPFLGILFTLMIGLMVFYIWIYNRSNMMVKEIEILRREEANLVTQNRLLRLDLDRLSRSDRIKQIAATEMNMVTPVPETLAVVISNYRALH